MNFIVVNSLVQRWLTKGDQVGCRDEWGSGRFNVTDFCTHMWTSVVLCLVCLAAAAAVWLYIVVELLL